MYYSYPNQPIGGSNPYYCCSSCGVSDPEINGRLDGHRSNCAWMLAKKRSLEAPLTLGRFVALAEGCNGVKNTSISLMFNAALFTSKEDRDIFYDLIQEQFPYERFHEDTFDGYYILQLKKND